MERIAIVVLAAGASTRFGPENKLLATIDGEAMVVGVVRRMSAVQVMGAKTELYAVTAAGQDDVARRLLDLPQSARPQIVVNSNAAIGIGTSIAAGIAALCDEVQGAMIVPGDMPRLTTEIASWLIRAFVVNGCVLAVHPVLSEGVKVGPVVWPRSFFADLIALDGAHGGQALLDRPGVAGFALNADDTSLLADIDTQADLAAFKHGRRA